MLLRKEVQPVIPEVNGLRQGPSLRGFQPRCPPGEGKRDGGLARMWSMWEKEAHKGTAACSPSWHLHKPARGYVTYRGASACFPP